MTNRTNRSSHPSLCIGFGLVFLLQTTSPTHTTSPTALTDCDARKPILLILPNVHEQTESKKSRRHKEQVTHSGGGGGLVAPNDVAGIRKKSLIDSGIEMLFKKSPGAGPKSSHQHHNHIHPLAPTSQLTDFHRHRSEFVLDKSPAKGANGAKGGSDERSKWRPFETIKIYTERRKSHDQIGGAAGDRKSMLEIRNSYYIV